MKKLISILTLVILTSVIYAQTSGFTWSKQAGGISSDQGQAIATDSNGYSYVTGYFSGTATFGTTTLVSNGSKDVFIAKLDTSGNWLWAKQAGGTSDDEGRGIATDAYGNSYVTGYFHASATFGTMTLASNGDHDIFISKLDTNGNWLWAKQAGGYIEDYGYSISTDSISNCYVTGYFRSSVNFGTTTLTYSGGMDIFVTKLDSNGNWLWAKQAGGTSSDYGQSITTDSLGNSCVTGYFIGTATFGNTKLVSNSNEEDVFIAKLDASGNWLWARQAGGTSEDMGYGIAMDGTGNCYVTGFFNSSANFGNITLLSRGSQDIFVSKLDANGNWIWAKQAGGTSYEGGIGIATDSYGNSYVTGYFRGSVTFGSTQFVNYGLNDIFIALLDTNGNWIWAKKAGGTMSDLGYGIAIDVYGNSYVSGYFNGSAVFSNTTLVSSGSQDIFITKVSSNPLLLIDDTSINFGTTYLGYNSSAIFSIRNFGGGTLTVDSLAFELTETHFEVMGATLPISIAQGDSVSLQLRFTPQIAGAVSDSLYIHNNSQNLPIAAIRLSGTGEYVPPKPPEGVQIVMDGTNAMISWEAVTETIFNTPIVPDYYLIFFNGSADPDGVFYYHGASMALQYTHYLVGMHSAHMFYRVIAFKNYSMGRADQLLSHLQQGMTIDEVARILTK